jgi:hypothetical protein
MPLWNWTSNGPSIHPVDEASVNMGQMSILVRIPTEENRKNHSKAVLVSLCPSQRPYGLLRREPGPW